jgi:hypothetical protein
MAFYPTIDTIRFGARLLASAQDVDPATLEQIVTKAALLGEASRLHAVCKLVANDDGGTH